MPRTILTGGWILAVLCLSLPALVRADILPATWTETLSLQVNSVTHEYDGQDANAPEPLSGTLSDFQYTVDGNVTFGQAGPPFVTAHVDGKFHATYGEFRDYHATSGATVNFEFAIVETQPPPVAVDNVPILVASHGSISAEETCAVVCFGGGSVG